MILGESGSKLGGIGGWVLLESNRIRVLLNLLGFLGLQANCGAGGNFSLDTGGGRLLLEVLGDGFITDVVW